ncbi:MAG: chromate transporter [Chloroflexota bacterium]|nr:chromate transporter [Chloroflexota bacterium]
MTPLLALVLLLVPLSLVSFGGIPVILPEIERAAVDVNGWVTQRQFADLYGLSQAAPGPNVMIVPAIGWWIGGVPGTLVTLIAVSLPPAVLAYVVADVIARNANVWWRRPLERGLSPIAVGLVWSSGLVLVQGSDQTALAFVVTAVSALVLFRTRTHPLLLLGIGALIGALGLV